MQQKNEVFRLNPTNRPTLPPMLNSDQKILIEFVEDRAIRLPVRKRIKVYRGLADFIDDKSVSNPLVRKAQILEDAESKCAQLNFKF
ncbi:MAG TPA: hypothetical protein VNU95_06005 [Candidatus Acidoferrales bacterium]|nr:hypothetical protein [Candidatus Acidoferrales bacterium]